MTQLIISEKPSAAEKIATALAEGKVEKKKVDGITYYRLTHKNKDIIVGCAVGHLYSVAEKDKKGWTYPVFSVEWKPTSETNKSSRDTKKFIDLLHDLSKGVDEVIVACDYDIEGEVIGLNIVRFACNRKDAARMKFSTLTKDELVDSYEHRQKHLDWPQANAGEARHILDWFYGMNLSRALTLSIKAAGAFKIMSSGRVQGPALNLLAQREKEIRAFKPVPFWQIELLTNNDIKALHVEDKFWDKKKAEDAYSKAKGHSAKVSQLSRKENSQAPPHPFDLTALQLEAYKTMRISPKQTLQMAQSLYVAGLISYPRTSSNQLPPSLNYKKIISSIKKQETYSQLCDKLLALPNLKPNNGKKTDPAHPAIYPTGEIPKTSSAQQKKLYDLIVRRTLASFGSAAIRETLTIDFDVNSELFKAKGTLTKVPGWHEFYGKYVMLDETELPNVKEGDVLKLKSLDFSEKETQPPKRYSPASVIKDLEKRGLGTKCFTADTKVRIISENKVKVVSFSELYASLSQSAPIKIKGSKALVNSKLYCLSTDYSNEICSKFAMVSKRNLGKNEKIIKITYQDGSIIKATAEHPFLMYTKNGMKYIPTKNLVVGDRSVASTKSVEEVNIALVTWDSFLEKCTSNSKLFGEVSTLKDIRGSISQKSFGELYNLDQSIVWSYEHNGAVPLYLFDKMGLSKPVKIRGVNKSMWIKNPFPLYATPAMGRILGSLVGDGSLDKGKVLKENCYDFRYTNTNQVLLKRLALDIHSSFGIAPVIKKDKRIINGHKDKFYLQIPALVGRILAMSFEELVRKDAAEIPQSIYPHFIGALFDDEGHAYRAEPKLFISNTNFNLLKKAQQMLKELGVVTVISKKQYKLYVYGRFNLQRFLEKVPIASIEKKQRLIETLSRNYHFGMSFSMPERERDLLREIALSKEGRLTTKELAQKVRQSASTTAHQIRTLRNNGYIKTEVIGISEYPRKVIKHSLAKPIDHTCYKYVGETAISEDFVTKTIKSIEEVNYDGEVYDITNSLEMPNFVLANGVVAHNSTRASIVDSLFQRGYVMGDSSIEVTDLGLHTIHTLEKYCPEILDEALTREFEHDMDLIRDGKKSGDQILSAAQKHLEKLLTKFKAHEADIGTELLKAFRETQNVANTIGKCPKCNEHDLKILYSRKTKKSFVACSGYPKCENTYSLPSGKIFPTDKLCEFCHVPIVKVVRAGKRPFQMCLTYDCKSKESWGKKDKEVKTEDDAEDLSAVVDEIKPKKKAAKKKKAVKKKSAKKKSVSK